LTNDRIKHILYLIKKSERRVGGDIKRDVNRKRKREKEKVRRGIDTKYIVTNSRHFLTEKELYHII
jgi:hypothetical protein